MLQINDLVLDAWGRRFFDRATVTLPKDAKVGLVIVHAANNAHKGWADFEKMTGLLWRSNSGGWRLALAGVPRASRMSEGPSLWGFSLLPSSLITSPSSPSDGLQLESML